MGQLDEAGSPSRQPWAWGSASCLEKVSMRLAAQRATWLRDIKRESIPRWLSPGSVCVLQKLNASWDKEPRRSTLPRDLEQCRQKMAVKCSPKHLGVTQAEWACDGSDMKPWGQR